jgi:hypothetical protein
VNLNNKEKDMNEYRMYKVSKTATKGVYRLSVDGSKSFATLTHDKSGWTLAPVGWIQQKVWREDVRETLSKAFKTKSEALSTLDALAGFLVEPTCLIEEV